MRHRVFTLAFLAAALIALSAPPALLATNPGVTTTTSGKSSSPPNKGGPHNKSESHKSGGEQPPSQGKHSANRTGPKAEEAHAKKAEQAVKKRPCAKSVNERADVPKQPETDPIEFDVHESDPVLNFGSERKTKSNFIVLKASQPIPEGVYSTDFEIDSLEPLLRIGKAELESERLPSPTYSRPHFFNHRKELAFNLCVKPTGDPGTYTGQLLFAGPGLISSVTLTQTAQLKASEGSFWLLSASILLITAVALILRAFGKLDKNHFGIKDFFAEGVVVAGSLIAAFLAMYLLYSENPTWGEKGVVVAGAALFAAAFTAAGLSAVVSGGTPKLADALSDLSETKGEFSKERQKNKSKKEKAKKKAEEAAAQKRAKEEETE